MVWEKKISGIFYPQVNPSALYAELDRLKQRNAELEGRLRETHSPDTVLVPKKEFNDVISDANELLNDGKFGDGSIGNEFFIGCIGDALALQQSLDQLKVALERKMPANELLIEIEAMRPLVEALAGYTTSNDYGACDFCSLCYNHEPTCPVLQAQQMVKKWEEG